jgi:hypothetical protein
VELDEEFAAALSEAITCCGSTRMGFAAIPRVFAAAFMSMMFWRSCSSSATELLRGSESSALARLFAPLPFELITFAEIATTATSSTARPKAGRIILLRRNMPRLRRELRGPAAVLRGPVAELRDPIVESGDAGLVASSIAVRRRDNAVPSVCARAFLPLGDQQCQKGSSAARSSRRKKPTGLPAFP